ncbi:MAG: hypothetical protein V7752_17945 [Halopseudomonas sp.]
MYSKISVFTFALAMAIPFASVQADQMKHDKMMKPAMAEDMSKTEAMDGTMHKGDAMHDTMKNEMAMDKQSMMATEKMDANIKKDPMMKTNSTMMGDKK